MKLNSLYLTRDLWCTKFRTNNIVLVRLLRTEFIIFFSFDIKTVNTLNSGYRENSMYLLFMDFLVNRLLKAKQLCTKKSCSNIKRNACVFVLFVADVAKNNDANP